MLACNFPQTIPATPSEPAPTQINSPAATATLPAPQATATPGASLRVVAYYPSWAVQGRKFKVGDIPAQDLTHIIYAFVLPSASGECASVNAPVDAANFQDLLALKARYPALKSLISIGGAGSGSQFDPVVASDASLAHFVQSCVALMQANGFDGIDVDWEYPATSQKDAFTALITAFRVALDAEGKPAARHYLLTMAAPAGPWRMSVVANRQVLAALDWVNLLTYDYYGSWSKSTGFNAPLYTTAQDPQGLSLDSSVQNYLAAGVPAGKLVVGVPFYGQGWQGVPDAAQGLYQPFTAPAVGKWGNGSFDYRELAENYLGKLPRYWDDQAKVPWLYDPQQGLMISYDDPESVGYKADYIREHGLGGAMIWQISADDAGHSLLKALKVHLTP
jgi:chitinase